MNKKIRIDLPLEEIPKQYYNLLPDLSNLNVPMAPALHPLTKEPAGPEDFAPLFPMELIKQEVSQDRYIDIPEEVREIYMRYRPSPLYRATRFEEALKTNARIYFKYEGVSPPGSHKPNTAIAQAYYNAKEGTEKLYTETGAGQWGTALAYAGQFFDIDVEVFMVRISYDQKPFRRTMMHLFGANVHPSPSTLTNVGREIIKSKSDHPGSLGIAISEAIEKVVTTDNSKYSLGSVLNHVLTHQSIIGLETQEQLKIAEEEADIVIGCLGGGSNFGGMAFPFVRDNLTKNKKTELIAVESTAAPKMTHGIKAYDYGDSSGMTPLIDMYTLGHKYVPAPIHAGGLRYHGAAPTVSTLLKNNIIKAECYPQLDSFGAAHLFAQTEGLIPAPETSHAIKSVIQQARKYPSNGNKQDGPVIVFCFSGHGYLDLLGYEKFLANQLENYPVDQQAINNSLQHLPLSVPSQLKKVKTGQNAKQSFTSKLRKKKTDNVTFTC